MMIYRHHRRVELGRLPKLTVAALGKRWRRPAKGQTSAIVA